MAMAIGMILFVLFGGLIGGLLSGIDRKITARMQGRRGPSVFQAFYDVGKLLSKDTLVLNISQFAFTFTFLFFVIFTGALFFGGCDLLLVFLALSTAAMFLIFVATSSNSAMSTMGAQREMMQMLSYEPMVLLTAVGFYMATGTFHVSEIAQSDIPAIVKLPGIFIGFVFILTIKLRKSPFDISTSHHAHQELVKGVTTDLSGKVLALVEIAHWYENVFLLGVIGLFVVCSGVWSIPLAILTCALVYFLEILIDNVSARVKWEVMVKLAWGATLICGIINLMVLQYMF